jgi:hypothetical protein
MTPVARLAATAGALHRRAITIARTARAAHPRDMPPLPAGVGDHARDGAAAATA